MFTPDKELGEKIAQEYKTPVFVTDAKSIRSQAQKLQGAFGRTNTKIFYAIKSNYDPYIIRTIKDAGIYGIDAVSPHEVRLALELGYAPEQIIFTPNNPSDEEMRFVQERGVLQNLGSLSELERFGRMFPESDVSMRICPEVGAGESHKMDTGGLESKFGIAREDLSHVHDLCAKFKLKLIGVHSHIGSGFYEAKTFEDSVRAVCAIASEFSDLQFVDLGGGFGVRYRPGEKEINLKDFAKVLEAPIEELEKKLGKQIESRIEPGKFLVTNSTALLVRVTTIKEKGTKKFVGVDSGMNHLIRPAMYDAYHHIVNTSRLEAQIEKVTVVGNVCETCDVFNADIKLAVPQEGDILAICSAGAYSASMSSNYNLRALAPHVLIDGEERILTRGRQSYEQIMETFTTLK